MHSFLKSFITKTSASRRFPVETAVIRINSNPHAGKKTGTVLPFPGSMTTGRVPRGATVIRKAYSDE
jgi:hypothetical protein